MPPHDESPPEEPVPLMQRLLDNIWLLLILGMAVMLIVYTGWGVLELVRMPVSTLP